MEGILEHHLLIWSQAFATISTIEKAYAGCMLCRPGLYSQLWLFMVATFGVL